MAQEQHDSKELQQDLQTRALEVAYAKASHQVDLVCAAEKSRQLRIKILFLEDEKDELQSLLAQDRDRITNLEKRNRDLKEDLNISSACFESTQDSFRIKARETETLKAELNSLHGVTMDSTRILAEKLTLACELSCLRPEVDHLRSQIASNQSSLAEKLALQRQVSSMLVELEAEKRSRQRALAKEDELHATDAMLESQIETLQSDLAKERRDRLKLEGESRKASTELENKKTALESRLDAFRTKLKSTKEQLKETQANLQTAQNTIQTLSANTNKGTIPTTTLTKPSRKRAAVHIDADTMIGTPGDLPAAKKTKRASSLVGEKSTFSITPFLNRTASVAPESPQSEKAASDGEAYNKPEDLAAMKKNAKQMPKPVSRSLELSNLVGPVKNPGDRESSQSSKVNSRVPPGRRPKAAPLLAQVAEEGDTGNHEGSVFVPPASIEMPTLVETINDGFETKKKKRKMLTGALGKTIFDDDEVDVVKGNGGLLGGVRGFRTLARGNYGGSILGPRKVLGTSMDVFGDISPRKGR